MEAPWTKSPEHILQHFSVNAESGLSTEQAAQHAELYGKNGTLNIHFTHSTGLTALR